MFLEIAKQYCILEEIIKQTKNRVQNLIPKFFKLVSTDHTIFAC